MTEKKRDTPWMKGNNYAQKGETKQESTLYVMCSRDEKNAYVTRAREEGKKLAVWVREVLNKELE